MCLLILYMSMPFPAPKMPPSQGELQEPDSMPRHNLGKALYITTYHFDVSTNLIVER